MTEEERQKSPDGWAIIQEKGDGVTIVRGQASNGDIYEGRVSALFNEQSLQMFVTIANNSNGVTVAFDCIYKWSGKESWQDEGFFNERFDSLSFWAIQNKMPTDFVKAVWRRSYDEFADALIRASYYALEVRHERDKNNGGQQGNLF